MYVLKTKTSIKLPDLNIGRGKIREAVPFAIRLLNGKILILEGMACYGSDEGSPITEAEIFTY